MKAAALLLLLGLGAVAAQNSQSVCQTYVVQAGDTISTIAAKFNVQQNTLEQALQQCINGYVPGSTFLQPNQRICLPPWYDACRYVSAAGGIETCKYYTIQPGDTLDSIANSLGLLRLDLEALNPNSNVLQVNQYIKLTGWSDTCPNPGDDQACRVYVAQEGDSLSSIAIAFSANLTELQAVNPSLGGDATAVLQPGQRVNIPPFTASCGAGVIVDKPKGNCRAYQVQPGDTLYSIAANFETTTDQLLQVNPALAAGGVLSPGTQVNLPPYNPDECVNGVELVTPDGNYSPPASDPSLGITEQPQPTTPELPAQTGAPAPAPQDSMAPGPAPEEGAAPSPARRMRKLTRFA